jgi:hypothetical protein
MHIAARIFALKFSQAKNAAAAQLSMPRSFTLTGLCSFIYKQRLACALKS